MVIPDDKPGSCTETEVFSQPRRWAESLRRLEEDPEVDRIIREFSSSRRWIYLGYGSSYYLALAAAVSWKAAAGLRARAFPYCLDPRSIPGGGRSHETSRARSQYSP
jgi:hypothetical protein